MSQQEINGRETIFLHIPKTGGTSVQKALYGGNVQHQQARNFTPEEWKNSFTFCFVRNPLDRTISHYKYHVLGGYKGSLYRRFPELKGLTFDEYIDQFICKKGRQTNFQSQYHFIIHPRAPRHPINAIFRFEKFESECIRLSEILGISIELPKLKTTSKINFSREDLTDKQIKKIRDAYACDYEIFGYAD